MKEKLLFMKMKIVIIVHDVLNVLELSLGIINDWRFQKR